MDTSIGWLLLLQVVLIALNAVFACAEIAVLSVNEVKLSKMVSEGSRKAKRLSRLTAQPARFLATIQVAITLAGFLGSAFAAENFSDPLVDWLVGLGSAEHLRAHHCHLQAVRAHCVAAERVYQRHTAAAGH